MCVCAWMYTYTHEYACALLSEVRGRIRAGARGRTAYESGRKKQKYQSMRGCRSCERAQPESRAEEGGEGADTSAEEHGRARLFLLIIKAWCPILSGYYTTRLLHYAVTTVSLQPLCSRSGSPDTLSISLSKSLSDGTVAVLARVSGGLRRMVAEGTYGLPCWWYQPSPGASRGLLPKRRIRIGCTLAAHLPAPSPPRSDIAS